MYTVVRYLHPGKQLGWRQLMVPIAAAILFGILGCGSGARLPQDAVQTPVQTSLPLMGYTIQVGAFANQDNAVRFANRLQNQGLNTYHFRSPSGLYKVRIGNYRAMDKARRNAENLKTAGIIDEYYLIGPDQYATALPGANNKAQLRKEIARTANRFIGVRYRWGGQSPGAGFDCSGLTMVVYRLNGLELPRSSRQQWKTGRPVDADELSTGDLVFFTTNGDGRVSHVGIYMGSNHFLHAPGSGRKIRISSLANRYFKSRYLGARSYF
jgi:cell wall-associated NlpC family hydrolase